MGVTLAQQPSVHLFDIEIAMSDSSFATYTDVTPDGVLGALIVSVLQAMAGMGEDVTPVTPVEEEALPSTTTEIEDDRSVEQALLQCVAERQYPVVVCESAAQAAAVEAALLLSGIECARAPRARRFTTGRCPAVLTRREIEGGGSGLPTRVAFSVGGAAHCVPAHNMPRVKMIVTCAFAF